MMGLTTEDAGGQPIPGMAESWQTSPDGLTWTFNLREAQWSDGTPVTAEDFVFAWRRILDPKTAALLRLFSLHHQKRRSDQRRAICRERRWARGAPDPAYPGSARWSIPRPICWKC